MLYNHNLLKVSVSTWIYSAPTYKRISYETMCFFLNKAYKNNGSLNCHYKYNISWTKHFPGISPFKPTNDILLLFHYSILAMRSLVLRGLRDLPRPHSQQQMEAEPRPLDSQIPEILNSTWFWDKSHATLHSGDYDVTKLSTWDNHILLKKMHTNMHAH